jgi:hypothetical protein
LSRVCPGVLALAILTGSASVPLGTAAPTLKEVLARAGQYAIDYGGALASVIADERFEQELVRRDGAVIGRRALESEIAFVKLAGTIEWLAFRNVLRVDGSDLPSAGGRLERLLREAPPSALGQARAIAAEGARHHLGPVHRNFNVPTTVLQFLLPRHQDRFRFRKAGDDRSGGEAVWIVEFRERDRATFIRTPEGRDAPSHGRLLIAPDDGRVVGSRLIVDAPIQAELEVTWQRDQRLGLWVPATMREQYRGRELVQRDANGKDQLFDVRGAATYSNYRRFEVDFRIVR